MGSDPRQALMILPADKSRVCPRLGSGLSSTCKAVSTTVMVLKKITTASKALAAAVCSSKAPRATLEASKTPHSNRAMGNTQCRSADMMDGVWWPSWASTKASRLATARPTIPAGSLGLRLRAA